MKFKHAVLSALFFTSVLMSGNVLGANGTTYLSVNNATTTNGGYITHIVGQGETVYSIANNYRVLVSDIYRLNPKAEKGIKIGETLRIPKSDRAVIGYTKHKIESKETLYGVARANSITVEDIIKANPGLDSNSFKSGKTIEIPIFQASTPAQEVPVIDIPKRIAYTVGKKETLYSISKAYGISIQDITSSNPSIANGLKEGMVIYLPQADTNEQYGATQPTSKELKIGILLPFLSDNGSVSKEKIVEYYEGILLAIQDAKAKGLNAEVFTFDIGSATNTSRLDAILETSEASSFSLIIGGISDKQIKAISKFSKDRGIKYVVPFGASEAELKANPYLYQAINTHSNLYGEVVKIFRSTYNPSTHNLIFINESGSDKNNKAELMTQLKASLTKDKIAFKTTLLSSALKDNLAKLLVTDGSKTNVIIPTSSAEITMRKLMPIIDELNSDNNISLFGYPEWQIYKSFYNSFHQYDTRIYSMFYFDDKQSAVEAFEVRYKKWFGRQLVNSYPKYAHLGYDTALYFLTAMRLYGNDFASKLESVKAPTLQSSIHFDKVSSNGGYINNGLYFIHYKPDSTIEKIEYNKQ